jgi:hypothetical protein
VPAAIEAVIDAPFAAAIEAVIEAVTAANHEEARR